MCVCYIALFGNSFSAAGIVIEHLTGLTGYQPKSVDGKFLVPDILCLFKSFQYKFETIFDEIRTELLSISKKQRKKIENLEVENIVLHNFFFKFEDKIDNNYAYERRDTIILSGKSAPPIGRDENCALLPCKLIKDTLNYVISPTTSPWYIVWETKTSAKDPSS